MIYNIQCKSVHTDYLIGVTDNEIEMVYGANTDISINIIWLP